jgi:hypothetical protein
MTDETKKSDQNTLEPHAFVEIPDSFPEKCEVCGGFKGDILRLDGGEGTPLHTS